MANPLNSGLVPATNDRELRALTLRVEEAAKDAKVHRPPQVDNGDEAKYADKSGTYTKGLLQANVGLVDLGAYDSFKKALKSGSPADFENIILGGANTKTLNGPQGGLAFYMGCLDGDQFHVPQAPAVTGEDYAAELIELYWASLLRDVAFADYPGNPTAQTAATEMSGLGKYDGPKKGGNVTPDLLFRGSFSGEEIGPYISQFLLQPADLGAFAIEQKYTSNKKGEDFMLTAPEFLDVQNGKPPAKKLNPTAPLFLHDERGLSGYTHSDVLYQAYLIAGLAMDKLNAPKNPGNPYKGSKTQNGFATFGGPDITGTLAAVAREALKAVWYQKWWVHLRHRPESGGALVFLQKTGAGAAQAKVSNTVLNSKAVQQSFAANNSYFLSQAFPEGSPTHPAYPTGHGTVAGACITVLKFFYNGAAKFDGFDIVTQPVVPASDGMSTPHYVAPGGEPKLTVNGELHKLASNISFGHGIHAGIHWRSDTKTSIQLGEAVAINYLRNQARTYNEKFSVSITMLDGTQETIKNP